MRKSLIFPTGIFFLYLEIQLYDMINYKYDDYL